RDLTVTGVQTCALPIYKNTHNYDLVQIDYFTNTTIIKYNFNYTIDSIYASTFDTINHIYYTCVGNYDQIAIYAIDVKTFSLVSRSEERRVGKDCRSKM